MNFPEIIYQYILNEMNKDEKHPGEKIMYTVIEIMHQINIQMLEKIAGNLSFIDTHSLIHEF